MSQATTMQARCSEAVGHSPAATLLLSLICFWMPKAQVAREGQRWIAKCRADWCREAGLTPKRYRTALEALKKRNLVRTEQHLIGNKAITFLRLTDEGAFLLAPSGKAHRGSLGKAQEGQPGMAQEGAPQKEVNKAALKAENEKTFSALCECAGAAGLTGEGETDFGEDQCGDQENGLCPETEETQAPKTMTEKVMATVKDVLLGKGKKPTVPAKTSTNPTMVLADIWRKTVPEKYGYVPPFTMKQLGQFKHFVKACPPGQAPTVLEKVLKDWDGFSEAVKDAAGWKQAPAAPELGFLVKFAGVAVTFGPVPAAAPKMMTMAEYVQLTAPTQPSHGDA